MLRARTSRGRAVALALCGLSAPLALAPIGAGDASGSARAARVEATARLLETRQSKILAAKQLPMSVDADDAVVVRLRGRSRIEGEEGKVARSRVFELEAGESAEVELPLTAHGQARLGRCDEQELVIKIRLSAAGDPLGDGDDGRGRIAERLVRDDPACAPE